MNHSRRTASFTAPLKERAEFAGKQFELTWMMEGALPPRATISGVRAICFCPQDQIVMISRDGMYWNVPGGHVEEGENCEEALRREVWEESCCRIEETAAIGCQRVEDMANGFIEYQMRYACRVRVASFAPQHEIRFRRFVGRNYFLNTLKYGNSIIARNFLNLSVQWLEQQHLRGRDRQEETSHRSPENDIIQ